MDQKYRVLDVIMEANICKNSGIICEFTIPYNPQQNGVSERMNRTLLEKARTMLINSKLDKIFWGDAILTACFLTNRSPCSVLEQNKTPYEMWHSRKPDFSKLQIFGVIAYAHVPKSLRDKLSNLSIKSYFIGYCPNGYRLWNIEKQKPFTARDVIFGNFELLDEKELVSDTDFDNFVPIYKNNEELIPQELVFQNFNGEINDNYRSDNFNERCVENDELENLELFSNNLNEENNEIILEGESDNSVSEANVESMKEPRWPRRDHKKPERFSYDAMLCVAMKAEAFLNDVPQTVHELKKRDDWPNWKEAIDEEMSSLVKNGTWTVLDNIPDNKKYVTSKWVFTIKNIESLVRYKARLVAKGCSQRPGFDYTDTFSPVVKITTIRIMLCLANKYNMFIHQMDVKTAYLNGDLEEEIYMKLPQDELGISRICKLHKSIYGLKQSGRSWYQKFDETISSLGYHNFISDACLYFNPEKQIYVLLYVDDILIICNSEENIDNFKNKISSIFSMKDLGQAQNFLGFSIIQNHETKILKISQKIYIQKLLLKFGMSQANPCQLPIDPNAKTLISYAKDTI